MNTYNSISNQTQKLVTDEEKQQQPVKNSTNTGNSVNKQEKRKLIQQ